MDQQEEDKPTRESLISLREEATLRVFDSDGKEPQHRECWICEPRKGYLKKINEVFICYTCGHVFFKGLDISPGEEENDPA